MRNPLSKSQPYQLAGGVTVSWHEGRKRWRLRWPDATKASGKADKLVEDADEALELALDIDARLLEDGPIAVASNTPMRMVLDHCLDPDSLNKEYAPGYLYNLERELAKWLNVSKLGSVPAGLVDDDHLDDLFRLARQSLAPSSVNQLGMKLSWLLREARRHGFMTYTPNMRERVGVQVARTVGQASKFIPRKLRPTGADVHALADAFREVRPGEPWRWLEVQVAGWAGLRYGELKGLTVEQVDLERQALLIDRQVQWVAGQGGQVRLPKYRQVRTAYFPSWLTPHLRSWLAQVEPGDPLFPDADGVSYERSETHSYRLDRARDLAGGGWLKERDDNTGRKWLWTMHSLRHHYATWCLDPAPDGLGLPVRKVSVYLGHASTRTTIDTYIGQEDDGGAAFRAADPGPQDMGGSAERHLRGA